jgi:hypothetical protein
MAAIGDERAGWLYDSIVGFLQSPEWSVPVMEFIDKHCIVFDTEDENKFEFTTVHNDFCEMVNNLLEGFLTDMGISPEVRPPPRCPPYAPHKDSGKGRRIYRRRCW